MYLIILLLSVLFVLASVFPITFYSINDLAQIEMGCSLMFIIQQQNYTPSFPWQTHLYSVWEPNKILWLQFFINIAIVFGVFNLVLSLVKAILKTSRR